MLNSHVFNTGERSPKGLAPYSPQAKRKNLDFTVHTPLPTPVTDYPRKEASNGAQSPHGHYYPQKLQPASFDASTERDRNLEVLICDLSERVKKISQKLGQHETILIKMTENSIQNNKEGCRKSSQDKGESARITESILEQINRLRKEFQDYRNDHIVSREMQVKTQLFSELIHKSEERMREEMQAIMRKVSEVDSKAGGDCADERLEEHDRLMKKLEKAVVLNSGKINVSIEKIEAISSSIDGHMDLVNVEVNKAIAKIVGFVNEKVSKPITENVELLSRRIEAIEGEIQTVKADRHFGGLRASSMKSGQQATRAQYRQTLTAYNSQIIISESTYYIDREGYLLDSQHNYLLDGRNEMIRLDERQIAALVSEKLLD